MQYRHTGALVEIGKIDSQLNVRLYVSENTIFPSKDACYYIYLILL